MTIIKSTFNDKKEQFNAMTNSEPLDRFTDQELTFTNYVIYEKDANENGECVPVVAFKTSDGDYVGSISSNIMDQLSMCVETFGDITPENPLTTKIVKKKSKNDRFFLSMVL